MFAQAALVVLVMMLFANYRNGTAGDWLRAKFLNAADPTPRASSSAAAVAVGRAAVDVGLDASGRLVPPVNAPAGAGFGQDRGDHAHAGIDFPVPVGTTVAAARSGRVTYAGASGDYGLRVDVDHCGGLSTRYAHLSALRVRVGNVVEAGQAVGLSGNTGRSTGPHLHFEVRRFGRAVDPAPYLGTPSHGSGASRVL